MDEVTRMALSALLGSLVGGGAVYKLFIGALENHMTKRFVLRKEFDDRSEDIVQLEERMVGVEMRSSVLEERLTQHWERTAEQMSQVARTIADVTGRLEAVTKAQYDLAIQMAQNRS